MHAHLPRDMGRKHVTVVQLTRNMALDNASMIVPSLSIAACFAIES